MQHVLKNEGLLIVQWDSLCSYAVLKTLCTCAPAPTGAVLGRDTAVVAKDIVKGQTFSVMGMVSKSGILSFEGDFLTCAFVRALLCDGF